MLLALRMVFEDKWGSFWRATARSGIGDFAGLHGMALAIQQVTEEIV